MSHIFIIIFCYGFYLDLRWSIQDRAFSWPEEFDPSLWPFSLDHAVYIWNNIPHMATGVCPMEILLRTKFDNYEHLLSLPVFGCPTYVLDPKLQDGKKLLKWVARSRLGQYLGVSKEHVLTVGLIRNLKTGRITPQYHVVYDNWFSSVPNFSNPEKVQDKIDLVSILTVKGRELEHSD